MGQSLYGILVPRGLLSLLCACGGDGEAAGTTVSWFALDHELATVEGDRAAGNEYPMANKVLDGPSA